MLKKTGTVILIILILIQFIPNELPKVIEDNKLDLIVNNSIPENIVQIVKTSCYDCHSNETIYPWYSYVAPVSFLIKRDTEVGRKELNFSDWENLDKKKKAKQLTNIIESIEEGEMPFPIYLITHSNAKLSDEQKANLIAWAEGFAERLFE
jgi:hypothetical protein